MRKRRQTEVFSLSFLDCICCGFGAVILFYMIISAQSGVERIRRTEDLASQVRLLEEQVLEGTKNLVVLRNTLTKTTSETVSASSRATPSSSSGRTGRSPGRCPTRRGTPSSA